MVKLGIFNTLMASMALAFLLSLCSSCSVPPAAEGNKRDYSFYSQYVNQSSTAAAAAPQVENLKLVMTGDEYPIRLALFEDGSFYYQIDRLGDGEGHWEYRDGVLQLLASRSLFDMKFSILAEKEGSQSVIIQFTDEFRFRSFNLSLRDGTQNNSQNNLPNSSAASNKSAQDRQNTQNTQNIQNIQNTSTTKLAPLRPFTKSKLGI
jgi:hypothetical protein